MNTLSPAEIAWLAGIYEGEGSCAITTGRAIRIEIVMTDKDIINRIHALTGFGSVRTLPLRNEKYKTAYAWGVGSIGAVIFLTAIMPWLGARRKERAQRAIENWNTNKKQSTAADTECVNGHKYSAPRNKRTKNGGCHLCHLEASKRYREKKKLLTSQNHFNP